MQPLDTEQDDKATTQSSSIFDNNWLATELERFDINYDNISEYPDMLVQSTINELEEWLKTTTYYRYIKIKQRKYKYMLPEKFNELLVRCFKKSSIALRFIDVFDVITTFYELDYTLSWQQLSYDNQIQIAKDIEAKTGNAKLLKQVYQSKIDIDSFDVQL